MTGRVRALRFICEVLTPWAPEGHREKLRELISGRAIQWERVVEVASERLVIAALHGAMATKGLTDLLPDDLVAYLREIHRLNFERNRLIRRQTEELTRELNALSVAPLLLKGAALLLSGKLDDPGARIMSDIDIMVPTEFLPQCRETARLLGYREIPDTDGIFEEAQHGDPFQHPSYAALLEIHHSLGAKSDPELVTTAQALTRSVVVSSNGLKFRLLTPAQETIYTVFHSEIHHGNYWTGRLPIKGLIDFVNGPIRELSASDWRQIESTFTRAGVEPVFRAYLHIARELFHCPTPSELDKSRAGPRHLCRCLIQLECKPFMRIGSTAGFLAWIYSEPRIRARRNCADTTLGLARGRLEHTCFLVRKHLLKGESAALWKRLKGRQE